MFNLLPNEIILEIFTYNDDVKSIINLGLVSHRFNEVVYLTHENKIRCLLLGKILLDYHNQIFVLEDRLIQDTEPVHPSIKKITNKNIDEYLDKVNKSQSKGLFNVFNNFKEDIIDALSDTEYLGTINPYHLTIPENSNCLFNLDDILDKAMVREKGDLFLYPNSMNLVGTEGIDDKCGRKWGEYGTKGGILPSVPCWITSRTCGNWPRHGHPVFGYCGIDEFLPSELFIGKKEDDFIMFPFKGRDVKLFLKQQQYRYNRMNFEDLIIRMAEGHGGICSPTYYTPPLSQEDQILLLDDFSERYKKSIGWLDN